MKKIITLALAAIMTVCIFALVGCETEEEPHVHSFGEWQMVDEASCTEEGKQTRICACGETEFKPISALGHSEVTVAGTPATCTESGLGEGKECTVCGEIMIKQEIIDRIGHQFDCHTETDENGDEIVMGICQRDDCGIAQRQDAPGLYAQDGMLLASWNELVNNYGLDIEKDYPQKTLESDETLFQNIIKNNSKLQEGTKLIISDSVNRIGDFALFGCSSLTSLAVPSGVTYIGYNTFYDCSFEVLYTGTAEEWANVERSQYLMGSEVLIRYEDKKEFMIVNFVPILGNGSGIMYGGLSVVVDGEKIHIGNSLNKNLYDCVYYDESFELEYNELETLNHPLISENERQEMSAILDKIKQADTWYMLRRYENEAYTNTYLVCMVDEAYYFVPITQIAENENRFLVDICAICRHKFGGYKNEIK